MYVFPAVDLRGGKVVRLRQGDYDRQTTYADDPVEQALLFESQGASHLHVVDLDGARTGVMGHLPQIEAICKRTSLSVQVGGGVRGEGTIATLLGLGVERVILGTAALKRWSWFEALMGNPAYRGRLILGLDGRQNRVAIQGWEQTIEKTIQELAREVSTWPLAALVVTDIAVDGTLEGPNIELYRELIDATDTPIIASGGVGNAEHLRALKPLKLAGVIVGRALYDGTVTLPEALAIIEGRDQHPAR
ncbi:MAG: 1-(5-phosphoribosyl)-5-[(5-phosphoribosylamino)methylideneamino]imidazole-4-carboxamide isomerase [Phycisphaeraceae bacterium]|nr:1-(5-phosphoribosyl)-5-[(5-phosphoribosylamino)methylideneamino]imidazole-4-carboxamide isomerase [Phycisphaeraceae bacterium]